MEQKMKRGMAVALSVLIHGVILFLVARFTIDLTTPEGIVDDGALTMEVMSEGSQTVSMDVSQNAGPTPSAPPTVAAVTTSPAPATPPPVAAITKPAPEAPPSEPEVTAQDSLIAMAAQENPPPAPSETPPSTTLQDETPAIGAAPMIEEPPEATAAAEPAAPPEALAATGATENAVSENFGVPAGATDAKTLTASPGNRRPEYPLMARFRRIQGKTVAQFTVAGDGTVSNARIFSSDNEAFNASVLNAVQTWKFKGPIVPGEYYWAFDFKLSGAEKEAPGKLRTK